MKAEIKSRLIPAKDLGDASIIKTQPLSISRISMGRVYGKTHRLVLRNMPTGARYEGFGGTFEADPYNKQYPLARSSILFLPDDVAKLVRDPLAKLKSANPSGILVFRFEVSSVRANNAEGYQLEYVPIGEFTEADPLSDVRFGFPDRTNVKTLPQQRSRAKGR